MKTVALIIPLFNEASRLKKTFTALTSFKNPRGIKVTQVIFVDDGSKDKTSFLVREFITRNSLSWISRSKIELISYKINQGKGYAIREGLKKSNADYSLFMDADMSTPLEELSKFVKPMRENVNLVIGTRKNGHSTVIKHQPLFRELLGKCFTKLTKIILGIKGTDFTCGFKALSKKNKEIYLTSGRISRWGYDAELIYLSQRNKLTQVEVPVVWSNDDRTKVKLGSAVLLTLKELITIKFHSYRGKYPIPFFPSPVSYIQ